MGRIYRGSLALLSSGGLFISSPTYSETVFKADFEAGLIEAEIGELTFRDRPELRLVAVPGGDPTLGERVLLVDREPDQEFGLSCTMVFSQPLDLVLESAEIVFDVAARRTNGASKTMFVTGWDRAGNAVFRLVLGDNGAFGNAGGDRQRPGYATASAGATPLPAPGTPGAFWWGSDTSDDGAFDASKDARFILSIDSTSWGLSARSQSGANYNATGLPTFNGGVHVDLAALTITNATGTNFGAYWDNLSVTGTVAGPQPEPAGLVLVDPAMPQQRIARWGYDIKQGGKAEGLTEQVAESLFVDDQMNLLRLPIWGDVDRPAHPEAGVVIASFYEATLEAIGNARSANPDTLLFASKKLQGENSFPDWTKDEDGVIPAQYAILLADFLRFMETNGVFIDLLGIDNETRINEGQITPAKYTAVIDELRDLSLQAPTFTVPELVGAEDFGPIPDWVDELNASGWGDRADLFGTHYYGQFRPLTNLTRMAESVGAKRLWNTEVHWDRMDPRDEMGEAETALIAFFDCTDVGMDGFSWWAYERSGFKGSMERALVLGTSGARPVPVEDQDGVFAAHGTLVTRAYVRGRQVSLWLLNNGPADLPLQEVVLADGARVIADARMTRWGEGVVYSRDVPVTASGSLALTLPGRSITMLEIPFDPAPSAFAIRSVSREPGGDVSLEIDCPILDVPYHVQGSLDGSSFGFVPGSEFTPDSRPFRVTLTPPGDPERRRWLVRVGEGNAP